MRIAAVLMLAAIFLAGCQTTPPGKPATKAKQAGPATKAKQAGPATPAEIAAALGNVAASGGVKALRKKGFKPYSDKGLKGKMAGKTLQIVDTYAFHRKDGALLLRDTGAGGATARGTWTVKNWALCYTAGGGGFCTGVFFRGKDVLCWPRIGSGRPATGYLRECRLFKGDVTNRLPVEGVVALMAGVPAANGIGAMGRQGFVPLSDKDVWRRIAGKTIEIAGSLGYYAPDRRVEIVNASLGGKLTSKGIWRIRSGRLCHSARRGHEFCTGLYFRGDEVLCWPGIGRYSRDTGYLRACGILHGNRVVSTPVPAVLAALETMSARNAPAALAKHGFVRLSGNQLWRRVAGRTLRFANSLGTYSRDKTIAIRDGSLGGELTSHGTWKIKKKNLCHTMRKDHEFCTALYFRGDELLCWPGIGRYARDTGYLRECSLLTGNQ